MDFRLFIDMQSTRWGKQQETIRGYEIDCPGILRYIPIVLVIIHVVVLHLNRIQLEGREFAEREETLLYNMNVPICLLSILAIITVIIVFRLFT